MNNVGAVVAVNTRNATEAKSNSICGPAKEASPLMAPLSNNLREQMIAAMEDDQRRLGSNAILRCHGGGHQVAKPAAAQPMEATTLPAPRGRENGHLADTIRPIRRSDTEKPAKPLA